MGCQFSVPLLRTSLAALDGVFAPAPHALAEALEELPCALVPALALLAAARSAGLRMRSRRL